MVMETEELAVAEGVTPVEPAVEPEAPETEPTLEEKLAKAEARAEKAEHDLNSARGQLRGKLDQEAFQQATRRHLKSIDDKVNAVAKGQISGDPAQTEQALAEATRTSQEQEQIESFNAEYVDIMEGILDEAEDMGIDARLPNGSANIKALQAAPELAAVLNLFDEGLRTKSVRVGRQAERAAKAVRRQAQTAAWEKEQVEEKKRNGSLSTPIPRASGNGRGMSWAQAQKIKSSKDLSDADYEKLIAQG